MTNQRAEVLQGQLREVYQRIQKDDAEFALAKLSSLRLKWPGNADIEHLAALAHKANNNYEQSIKYFVRSLKINKQQPQVHNNLANLYKANKQFAKAEKHYIAALCMQPNYFDAMRNIAFCHSAQRNYSTAAKHLIGLLKLQPDDVSALTGLADCHREMAETQQAHKMYKQALSIEPLHVNAWHNMGLNYHLCGELDDAVACYEKAYSIAPDRIEVAQSLASTLHENGATSQAIDLFNRALKFNPGSVLMHERLNEMLWEVGLTAQFCSSYTRAIEQEPDLLEIRLSYISQLFRAAQIDQAAEELELANKRFKGDYQLLSLKGQIEAERLNYSDACHSLSASLASRFTKDAAHALTKIYVIQSQYKQAKDVLEQLFNEDPDCQLTWALQSLVWRLTNDDRYYWLNNYDQLVRTYKMDVPEGYASLDEFLQALEGILLGMHRTEHAPLQQTLRHGTQTAARLLSRPAPEIVALKQCLTDIVRSYINEMADDVNHPMLSRKNSDFDFSGSWSVKLQPNGFHVNHVHSEGWISSAVYISIPRSMTNEGNGLQGAIKFGESPLGLGSREVVEKTIMAEPGTVVLFPSYMWHGTYPYDGADNDFRLTSPFDVIPNNRNL